MGRGGEEDEKGEGEMVGAAAAREIFRVNNSRSLRGGLDTFILYWWGRASTPFECHLVGTIP